MPETEGSTFAALRHVMTELIAAHTRMCSEDIQKERLADDVMAAMGKVPRHQFVPVELQPYAYQDVPLPIGCGKTISQPFMVALMTDLLEITKQDKVLEVGTGLGYQAAILAELADQVFTIEIHEELACEAQQRLRQTGVNNIQFRIGDGARGWPEHAPYDKIMVTAAPERLPSALLEQLKPSGKMVIPIGQADEQKLTLVSMHTDGRVRTQELLPVLFSSLTISH